MSELQNAALARETFDTLCRALDKDNWKYKKNEEDLEVECTVHGEDLPMDVTFRVRPDKMVITLLSHIPFVINEDKRIDAAIAVSAVNNMLVDGCFDYNVTSGHIFFRMAHSFVDSKISEEVFIYMLICSCQTIDDYNDKFLMLSKGMMSLDQFIASLQQ